MKPSPSRLVVLRALSPLALGFLAACSSSEPSPGGGVGGTAGVGGSVGGAGASSGGLGNGGSAGSPSGGSAGLGGSAGGFGGGVAGGGAGQGGISGGGGGGGSGGGGSGGTAGTAGSGGLGGSAGEAAFGAAFKAVAQIIESRCASACHGMQEGFENRNDLRTANLGNFYTHLTTPLMSDLCYGKKLVVPGDPETSLLIVAIKGEENDCGLPRMPSGCQGDACLSTADIEKIESWIEAGAPKN